MYRYTNVYRPNSLRLKALQHNVDNSRSQLYPYPTCHQTSVYEAVLHGDYQWGSHYIAPTISNQRSRIVAGMNPLTPLLIQHSSPLIKDLESITCSEASPLALYQYRDPYYSLIDRGSYRSNAQRLEVPSWPPFPSSQLNWAATGGVTQRPALQK